jgi:3-dehydroquinate dehydratase-2
MAVTWIDRCLILLGRQVDAEERGTKSNDGGMLINTSVALCDAIAVIEILVVEVHLSNVYAREQFRLKSFISAVCKGKITGFDWHSYTLGLRAVIDSINKSDG